MQLTTLKRNKINGYIYDFSVDYNTIGFRGIVDIHKYLMRSIIIQAFIALLSFNRTQASTALLSFNRTLVAKLKSLNNENFLAISALINLNPNELHYYQFVVSLGRYNRRCNTLDDPSGKIYVPNKKENVNLIAFNVITSINESKTLIKSIFHKTINVNLMVENIIQVKSGVIINTDVGAKIQ